MCCIFHNRVANTLINKIFLIIFLSFSVGNVFSQDSIQNNLTCSNYSSLYYNYENGVSNMLSVQDIVRLRYNEKILFSFAWRFHLNQQVGLGSFYLAVEEWQTNKAWLAFGAEYEHHEHPAYEIGENQVALISFFKPWEKVRFGTGFTYRAVGPVVYFCTDLGLSTFNGNTWVSYQRNESNASGKVMITNGPKLTDDVKIREFPVPTSICHNFTIGVDVQDDEIWVANSYGVSRGERLKK